MKKILYLAIVIIPVISCQRQEKDLCFYDKGNIFSETYIADSLRYVTIFFNNGNIRSKLCTLNGDSLLQNRYEEYYPDGFSKNSCSKIKGRGITTKEMCKTSGYEIKIDFGPYENLENGKRVRPFRTFVKNVDKHEYRILTCDTSGIEDSLFKRMSPCFVSYKTICNTDTSIVEIDESLYTYYIDDLPRITHQDSSGRNYFYIDFFYKSALTWHPNDSRIVIMHDSLNWEVREYDVKYVEE